MSTSQSLLKIGRVNMIKHEFLKKATKVTMLCFVMAASLALAFLPRAVSTGAGAQQPNSNQRPDLDPCEAKEDGAACPLTGSGGRECRVGRCRNSVCTSEPVPAGTSCNDTDGSTCTIARCSAAGTCDQRSRIRPDGTPCSDGTPGCSGGQICNGGQCLPPPGVGDPSQVATVSLRDVEVSAADRRVGQATAFSDCCDRFPDNCDEQFLQAIVPTSDGPKPTESDTRLPLRRKFCGTVTKYAVNDENADPRDFNINIRPAAVSPYPNFVAGLVKTDATPRFNSGACDLPMCLKKASDLQMDQRKFLGGKVIHAELTPDEHFYGADGRFLPIESSFPNCGVFPPGFFPGNKKCTDCITGEDCLSELEPRDGFSGAEACVYGVYSYDHGGHRASSHPNLCCSQDATHDLPEIHPFDSIWWRHPERNGWMFAVFQDDSNRYSFPHCSDEHNGNTWSQAPRDMTFNFPFRFPRRSAPQKACLRHVRTRKLRDNAPNIVRPLNVTTGEFVNPATEVIALTVGGQRLLEVVKEVGTGRETHVRVVGRIVGEDVVGEIILRVAVGCDERNGNNCVRPSGPRDHRTTQFDSLRQTNGLVTYDEGDPGAGYFYAELTFECACSR
jgi:hypothetical protein